MKLYQLIGALERLSQQIGTTKRNYIIFFTSAEDCTVLHGWDLNIRFFLAILAFTLIEELSMLSEPESSNYVRLSGEFHRSSCFR